MRSVEEKSNALNLTLINECVELLEQGIGIADTCRHVGISGVTFRRWYKLGRKRLTRLRNSPDLFIDFYRAILKARVVGKKNLIDRIRFAANKDWKAAAYLLERLEKTKFVESSSDTPLCAQTAAIEAARKLLEVS